MRKNGLLCVLSFVLVALMLLPVATASAGYADRADELENDVELRNILMGVSFVALIAAGVMIVVKISRNGRETAASAKHRTGQCMDSEVSRVALRKCEPEKLSIEPVFDIAATSNDGDSALVVGFKGRF